MAEQQEQIATTAAGSIDKQTEKKQQDGGDSSGEEVTMEEYLLYSARCNEIEGMQECLDAKVPIDYQNEDMGNAALHLASANGHLPAITFLLENGATVNLLNKSKNTPLHWACLLGQFEAVKLLCEWQTKNPDRPES